MSAAAKLVEEAARVGLRMEVAGDRLRLHASAPPPAELLDRLRAAKPDLLALLRRPHTVATARGSLPISPAATPTADTPEAWRSWYGAQVSYQQQMAYVAGRTGKSALQVAYGAAQDRWHRRHGERPNPEHCGGCREPLASSMTIEVLADKARIHPSNECLIAYGARWRAAAADGLRRLGIEAPEGWEP